MKPSATPLTLLMFCLVALAACVLPRGSNHQPQATSQVTFRARVKGLPPTAQGVAVEMHRWPNFPPGFTSHRRGTQLLQAPNIPTADNPHVVVGLISVSQRIPHFRNGSDATYAKRDATLVRTSDDAATGEARARGANALVFHSSKTNRYYTEVTRTYIGLKLSTAKRAYPTVDDLIASLKLPKHARIAKRIETTLEQLKDTRLRVPLKRGHCYTLALAFKPEPIQRNRGHRATINFEATLGTGRTKFRRFTQSQPANNGQAWQQLDGDWSRVTAGEILCPSAANSQATIRFGHNFAPAHINSFDPGTGPIDLVVLEEPMDPNDAADAFCNACRHTAKSCDRRKLRGCEPLRACLKKAAMSVDSCMSRVRY